MSKVRASVDGLVPDGRDFDLPIPPMEVKNWPQEWESPGAGGHTKPVGELVRMLVSLMGVKDKL